MLRLGKIQYLNILPYWAYWALTEQKPSFEWVEDVPTGLNRRLHSGMLDVSFVSSIEYLQNQKRYHLLPQWGIAASEKVLSVNLYTRFAPHQLSGKTIGLTTQSATSAALLKLLCRLYWKVEPQWQTLSHFDRAQNCDAFLLIGDDALRLQSIAGYTTVDLAQCWWQWQRLPFCFAVCVAQNQVAERHSAELQQLQVDLSQALDWSFANPQLLVNWAVHCFPQFSRQTINHYFQLLTYRLGQMEIAGLKRFGQLLELPLSKFPF